jgi:pimeloyl-ACP methyl ester carboxylesterase
MLRNDPRGLAAALCGLGAGVMAPLWDRLDELTMPATVLAGERDAKYVALARDRLVPALPDAELVIVADAGHGLPREAPQAIVEAIAHG